MYRQAIRPMLLLALVVAAIAFPAQNSGATGNDTSTQRASQNAPSAATWSMTYGGSGNELFNDMIPTGSGSYLAIGNTTSFGSGLSDLWLVKLDSSGKITWQKAYGGPGNEVGTWVAASGDGYIVSGATASFGAVVRDLWALRLDSSGNILWQKTYGGPGDESFPHIIPTQDGGYAFLGQTNSFGAGAADFWLLKLDSSGNVTWQKTYGGPADDVPQGIIQTADGGYLLAGSTKSFGAGNADGWVLKLDGSGKVTWQKTYGGPAFDEFGRGVLQIAGGYIVSGDTSSFGAGGGDAWVLRLDNAGAIIWQNTYGGPSPDYADLIQPIAADGGYVFTADTNSFGVGGQAMVFKLDSTGSVTWQKAYGGAGLDSPNPVLPVGTGYIAGGFTESFGHGGFDAWVWKVDDKGEMAVCPGPVTTTATAANSAATVGITSVTPGVTTVVPGATTVTPVSTTATALPGATTCQDTFMPTIMR